jgi:hydroxyethylthiazole kinase-like uncharacterized protein yjeF
MNTPLVRLLPSTSAVAVWSRTGIRALEAHLQATSPTPLMDLAGLTIARLALAVAPHGRLTVVMAGPGNNGGDGLEAALHLHCWGKAVQVHLLCDPQQWPADARRAFERASQAGVPLQAGLPTSTTLLDAKDLCIDALLGIGATRAPDGKLRQAIDWMNASGAQVLAVDIPTGLDADSGQPLGGPNAVVKADHTLTLLGSKPGLFMGHGRDVCGTLWLGTLGLTQQATDWQPPDAELNPPAAPATRAHASHKGSHGDVAVVGGETGMTGAALLAASAALHGGAGRVMLTLLGPQPAAVPPDLMLRTLPNLDLPRLTVVAGCGGGRAVAEPLDHLLQYSARLVLDADALNRLAEDSWLQDLLIQRCARQQATVLTPHPLEAARLLDCNTAQVQADRLGVATQLAQRFACCVVLKGSGTVIVAPGHTPRINTTGNGLLATGGTGDALAGLTAARLAVSGNAWQAACDAAWTHGQVADKWPPEMALTASQLAAHLR